MEKKKYIVPITEIHQTAANRLLAGSPIKTNEDDDERAPQTANSYDFDEDEDNDIKSFNLWSFEQ